MATQSQLALRNEFQEYITKDVAPRMSGIMPKGMDMNKLVKQAFFAGAKNPALYKCNKLSIAMSLMTAAELGLEPDGTTGQAYLIPYGDVATLVIGYKGLMELAYRTGKITQIDAHVIYECDDFDFEYGTNQHISFKMNLKARSSLDGPGRIIGVYAQAFMKDGSAPFVVLSERDILDAKGASKAKSDKTPWKTHFAEMAKKTAIRRLCKYLPLSTELDRAVAIDTAPEYGGSQADFISPEYAEAFEAEAEVIEEEQGTELVKKLEKMEV